MVRSEGPVTTKPMPLGDILSVTTGALVSRDHMDGLYRILNHMTGEPVFTHQIPRVGRECTPRLLEQHPQLADITVPDWSGGVDKDTVYAWLDEMEAIYGTELPVTPLAPGDHTSIGPLTELAMNYPHLTVMPVVDEGDA